MALSGYGNESLFTVESIDTYMQDKVAEYAPGNWWWQYHKYIGWVYFACLYSCVFAIIVTFVALGNDVRDSNLVYIVVTLVVLLTLAFLITDTKMTVYPDSWRYLTLKTCMDQYPWVNLDPLWKRVRSIRASHPEAEFQTAVIFSPDDRERPKEVILFQILEGGGRVPTYAKGEKSGRPLLTMRWNGEVQREVNYD